MASIAEILLAKGRMMADARQQSGERSSQLAQNLAGIAANSIGTYLEQKEDRPYRDARTRQIQLDNDTTSAALSDRTQKREDTSILQSAMSSGMGAPEVESQLTQLGRGDLVSQFKATKAKDDALAMQTRETKLNLVKLQTEYLRDKARRMRPFVDGPEGMHVMEAAIKEAVEDGAFDQQEADQFWQQISGNPEALPKLIDALDPQEVKAPRLMSVNPGDTVINQDTGQSVFTAPAEAKPDTRSPQQQANDALRAGDTKTYQLIMRGQRDWAAAGRAPDKPDDPMAVRERQLRIQKLEQDLAKAAATPSASNEKLEAVAPVLDEITELAGKIFTTDAGPWTNIVGAWKSAGAAANVNNDVREYRSLVRGFTPLMARAVGHNGVLTEKDVERTEMLFPGLGLLSADNTTVANNKLERMKRIMVGGGTDAEKAEVRKLMGWDTGTTRRTPPPPPGRGATPAGNADPLGLF